MQMCFKYTIFLNLVCESYLNKSKYLDIRCLSKGTFVYFEKIFLKYL